MPKKATARNRILKYLEKYPDAKTHQVAENLKVNAAYVSTIRNQDGCKVTKVEKITVGVKLSIDVQHLPAEIKVNSNGRIIGTLYISNQGISYSPNNAKKKPDRLLKFEMLKQIQALGMML